MHLPLPQGGALDEGEAAIDLEIAPADVLFLSFADSELAALYRSVPSDAGYSVGFVDLKRLRHPLSIDLLIDNTVAKSKIVVARVLGGSAYWPYGVERLSEMGRRGGVKIVLLPGDQNADEPLQSQSSAGAPQVEMLRRYFLEGGSENYANLVAYAAYLVGDGESSAEPIAIPRHGVYRAEKTGALGSAVLVFYRALLEANALHPVDGMIDALKAEGMSVRALYVSSPRSAEDGSFLREQIADAEADIVLNATAFAISQAGAEAHQTPLDATGTPVLQVVFSGITEAEWTESNRGLAPRDFAMHVVMPEVDGRIHAGVTSFKSDPEDAAGFTPREGLSHLERASSVAKLTANWARLRRSAVGDRRVALILANYPNKDGRLGNGVGLDTPASTVAILKRMSDIGFDTAGAPAASRDLMDLLLAGSTNAKQVDDGVKWPVDDYLYHFGQLPATVCSETEARWGSPEDDPFVEDGRFCLPVHCFGKTAVMIQPARGYNIDPKTTYHDPDLVPPHGYLAAYLWLREAYGAHAVVHVGKHGTLEWLPGKSVALSAACYPDVVLGALPNLYPFIVNDPGEGAQAKRRTAAVVIDHLTPPMARAESHGVALRLEGLLDEYAQAQATDPKRAARLEKDIQNLAEEHGFHEDLGSGDDLIPALDNHLCDLKELQIRDGLHVFGSSPGGDLRTAHLSALVRVSRGGAPGDASLHRAIANDLGLDFDPLTSEPATPWEGHKPDVLEARSDDPWRIAGDTIERIELLSEVLIAGRLEINSDWSETRAVLEHLNTSIAPKVDASGERELDALMAGLSGRFVPPGPSGAPTRGRPDVLPTGRNFYAVDVRAVPSQTAWALGQLSAERLVERYFQDEGEWPKAMVVTCWGTANMRTGGDDIAQALALIGARPVWDPGSSRVTGYEIVPLSALNRPRVDVTLRVSGFFRDAFPQLIALFDTAASAIAALDEPDDANPIAANISATTDALIADGATERDASRRARYRVFGSKPGSYGAGLQTLIDEDIWSDRADFAESYLVWGSYAYGADTDGTGERGIFEEVLTRTDAIVQNQDNREHDLLDSDDYYQFEGGLSAAIERLKGGTVPAYHNDHSRPDNPKIRSLDEEIARVVRGRAANPKWVAGVMRHGYKGAFEMAATLDYLYAFAATTDAVKSHHFDQLYAAYFADQTVRDFIAEENPPAFSDMAKRFLDAIEREMWQPRLNSVYDDLSTILDVETKHLETQR
ncbi:MAG: cobaltochelatase subunit CobN [Pseudomonadota bacterium]